MTKVAGTVLKVRGIKPGRIAPWNILIFQLSKLQDTDSIKHDRYATARVFDIINKCSISRASVGRNEGQGLSYKKGRVISDLATVGIMSIMLLCFIYVSQDVNTYSVVWNYEKGNYTTILRLYHYCDILRKYDQRDTLPPPPRSLSISCPCEAVVNIAFLRGCYMSDLVVIMGTGEDI